MDYAIKAALAMLQNKLDLIGKDVKEIRDLLQSDPNRIVNPGIGFFNEVCPSCQKLVSFDPDHLGNCKVSEMGLVIICPHCSNEWFGGLLFSKETEEGEKDADKGTDQEPGTPNP